MSAPTDRANVPDLNLRPVSRCDITRNDDSATVAFAVQGSPARNLRASLCG